MQPTYCILLLATTIQTLPYPTTVKEVQTFIGMVQYFALYIPMLAEYKAKLTELTLKDANFNELWSDDHKKACDMIKNLLQDSILYIIDWKAELWLVTDASGHGLGGCLLMKKEDRYYPLRFLSRVLTKLERAYENREREIRAGVYCMQSLHVYLEHRVFYWAVDHLNIYHCMVRRRGLIRWRGTRSAAGPARHAGSRRIVSNVSIEITFTLL